MAESATPSILTALNNALKVAEPAGADAATVALAKRYAAALDAAERLVEEAEEVLYQAMAEGESALAEQIAKLRAKVDAQAVAALIGPKLLDVLAQLQLTPAARKAIAPPGGGGGNGTGGSSALGNLRAIGGNRAKAVDAPAS